MANRQQYAFRSAQEYEDFRETNIDVNNAETRVGLQV